MGQRTTLLLHRVKVVMALVLITLLAVFVFSNTDPVALRFFSLRLEAPASLVVLLSSIVGAVLFPLLRTAIGKSGR